MNQNNKQQVKEKVAVRTHHLVLVATCNAEACRHATILFPLQWDAIAETTRDVLTKQRRHDTTNNGAAESRRRRHHHSGVLAHNTFRTAATTIGTSTWAEKSNTGKVTTMMAVVVRVPS